MPSYHDAVGSSSTATLDPARSSSRSPVAARTCSRRRAPIPEAAAQWLRDEPEVQRVVGVETDLGEIQSNIDAVRSRRSSASRACSRRAIARPCIRRSRRAGTRDRRDPGRPDQDPQRRSPTAAQRWSTSSGDLAQRRRPASSSRSSTPRSAIPSRRTPIASTQTRAGYDAIDNELDRGRRRRSIRRRRWRSRCASTRSTPSSDPADQKAHGQDRRSTRRRPKRRRSRTSSTAIRNEIALGKDLAGVGDDRHRSGARAARAAQGRAGCRAARARRVRVGEPRSRQVAAASPRLGDRAAQLAANARQYRSGRSIARSTQGLDEVEGVARGTSSRTSPAYKAELAELRGRGRARSARTCSARASRTSRRSSTTSSIRTDVGIVDVVVVAEGRHRRRSQAAQPRAQPRAQAAPGRVQGHPRGQTKKPSAPRKSDLPPIDEEPHTVAGQAPAGNDRRARQAGGDSRRSRRLTPTREARRSKKTTPEDSPRRAGRSEARYAASSSSRCSAASRSAQPGTTPAPAPTPRRPDARCRTSPARTARVSACHAPAPNRGHPVKPRRSSSTPKEMEELKDVEAEYDAFVKAGDEHDKRMRAIAQREYDSRTGELEKRYAERIAKTEADRDEAPRRHDRAAREVPRRITRITSSSRRTRCSGSPISTSIRPTRTSTRGSPRRRSPGHDRERPDQAAIVADYSKSLDLWEQILDEVPELPADAVDALPARVLRQDQGRAQVAPGLPRARVREQVQVERRAAGRCRRAPRRSSASSSKTLRDPYADCTPYPGRRARARPPRVGPRHRRLPLHDPRRARRGDRRVPQGRQRRQRLASSTPSRSTSSRGATTSATSCSTRSSASTRA